MFNWLFKKLQLGPPKLDHSEVEKKRNPKTKRMQEWDQLNELVKFHISNKQVPALKTDLEFPKGVYDDAASKVLQEMLSKPLKPFIILGKTNARMAPPKPKVPMIPVPHYDYRLLKIIRINIAKGIETIISTPEQIENMTPEDITEGHLYGDINCDYEEDQNNINHLHHINAKVLYDYYGLTKDEIFQLTGCVLE